MNCKIDLSFLLTGLDGKSLKSDEGEEVKASRLLAHHLANSNAQDFSPIKAYDWATKLYKEGIIEVDEADRSKLEKFVENNQTLTNLSKAQIIKAIQEAKEK